MEKTANKKSAKKKFTKWIAAAIALVVVSSGVAIYVSYVFKITLMEFTPEIETGKPRLQI